MMFRFISRETKRQAVLLFRRGEGTLAEIAATVPCHPSAVSRWNSKNGFRFTPEELNPNVEAPVDVPSTPAPAHDESYLTSLERENALLTELLALRAARNGGSHG